MNSISETNEIGLSEFARRVMESFPYAVMVIEQNGTIRFVNEVFCEFSGCDVDSLLKHNVSEVSIFPVPWDNESEIPDFLSSETEWVGERKYISSKGYSKWGMLKFTPCFEPDGKIFAYILTVLDITDRKKAEETAIKNESRFRSILQNINEYIYSVDYEDGKPVRTYHSPRCVDVTGYTPRDFDRDPDLWYHMVHPDDRVKVSGLLGSIGTHGHSSYIEHRIIDKRGRVRWVSNSHAIHRDINGNILRMDGYIQDITALKETVSQLRKLSVAVDQSPSSVVITDRNGLIEYVNPKFTRITGYSLSEVLGKNPRILKSGQMSQENYKQMWDTILAGNEWHGEFHNKKNNGDLYWESASISPLRNTRGEVTHFIAVKEDITDRKKAEEALKVRNEMMEEDLKYAQAVQKALLPSTVPSSDIVKITYRFLPLDMVGGDFFSFMHVRKGIGVFIGDIAGHGVSSALFLSLIRFATEDIARKDAANPSTFLLRLNEALCRSMSSYFITAQYGYFHKEDNDIAFSYASGAHPAFAVQRAGSCKCELVKSRGGILGIFSDMTYAPGQLSLSKGDRIFMYTDGIPETRNSEGKIVGFDNIPSLVEKTCHMSIDEACDSVLNDVALFRGDEPVEDDIVLIGCEVL